MNHEHQPIHLAAKRGDLAELARMLAADPAAIEAKGIDDCTPLHCASTVEAATFLLDHGARIDARDADHNSTPAQWLIGDSPAVSRFLLDRGAAPDLFLAVALGDRPLVERLIAANPDCTSYRIGGCLEFPAIGSEVPGGTIYQWTLKFNSYPHQIALLKGHTEIFDYLYERSSIATRLLVNCVLARRAEAEAIVAEYPSLIPTLPGSDLEILPKYCWETNTNYDAVKLMLDLGFPVAHPEHAHGFTPLHNAAWQGNPQLVQLLIERGHPVDLRDPRFHATPLGWALHCCFVDKRHPEGQYADVVRLLVDAGCPVDENLGPTGEGTIDAILSTRLPKK